MKKWTVAVLPLVLAGAVWAADFNGDGTNEIGIFRPASGLWAIRGMTRIYYGTSGDVPMPGDYDGDGNVDIALYRPGNGLWAVKGLTRAYYGASGDNPLIGVTGNSGSWPPLAYGVVWQDGQVEWGSGNFTVEWNGSTEADWYEIQVQGLSFSFNDHMALATPAMNQPRIVHVDANDGKLLVYAFDLTGNKQQTGFQFVIYGK